MDNNIWIIFAIGAVIFFIGWLFHRHHTKVRKACTVQTTGEVIDIVKKVSTDTDSDGHRSTSTTYTPVFRYMVDGQSIERQSTTGTGWQRFKKGQTVTLFYDPAEHTRYYVKEDKAPGMAGFAFMGFGVLLFIIGFVVIFTN